MAAPVSDMLVTVKSRELQRAMLAELRGARAETPRYVRIAAPRVPADALVDVTNGT
jgi:hypothetical protein